MFTTSFLICIATIVINAAPSDVHLLTAPHKIRLGPEICLQNYNGSWNASVQNQSISTQPWSTAKTSWCAVSFCLWRARYESRTSPLGLHNQRGSRLLKHLPVMLWNQNISSLKKKNFGLAAVDFSKPRAAGWKKNSDKLPFCCRLTGT